MATGTSAFEKTLIGVEVAPGDSTVPTTYWRGIGKIKDKREVRFPPQKIGKIGGTTRSYIPITGSEVMLEDEAAFEPMCHIFNAAIYETSSTTDASSAKIYSWSVQGASSDPISATDLGTMVVESGDNNDADRAHYCHVMDYTLSGKQGEAVHIVANLRGQSPSTCSFTAVGTTDLDNDYETILSSMGTLYIDPSTDTPGTTAISETLIDWSLKHTTGWVPLEAKDGRTDFSSIKHIDDEILLDVTFEHNTNASTQRAAWRSEAEKVIRLQFAGSGLTTTSSDTAAYSTKILRLDMYGKWVSLGAEGLEEQNGDNIVRGTFRIANAQRVAKKMDVVVVTQQAALP